MKDLMGERDVPGNPHLDEDDMIQFYRQFLSSELRITSLINRASAGGASFSSQLVYRGYMDDKSNTDNAWVDAEIWNFHFNRTDTFDQKIVEGEKRWREVSVLMQLDSSQLHHVLEVAKMHSSKA
ncbi:transient receptor potential cation channel subfamily M member 2 [Elysia marginata]|uniref:Transient receptor potential cation channel subfamily M member 2 n=1 Tax=Elysia marginata TaxID=1093978 RepID=A0AAV4JL33_9GAST|nr:transient receptor potential cation channel subfamily M member 2 [Elysia marginata]